jgi:hypothetical protein
MLVPMGFLPDFLEGPIGGYFVRCGGRKQSDFVIPGRLAEATPE